MAYLRELVELFNKRVRASLLELWQELRVQLYEAYLAEGEPYGPDDAGLLLWLQSLGAKDDEAITVCGAGEGDAFRATGLFRYADTQRVDAGEGIGTARGSGGGDDAAR
jgi:hypothetical protein